MNYTVTYLSALSQIEEKVWDSIASDSTPFLQYAFLNALETSGCVQQTTGWQPHHMIVKLDNIPVAVLPLYIKHHSYGEYVFDQEWARAYHQYEMRYYPKLLSSIPFTPVTGPRLICAQPALFDSVLAFTLEQIRLLCDTVGFSSWHCLFTPQAQSKNWQNLPLLQRTGVQFQWQNRQYESFDHYLATLHSKKRKTIKRERRRMSEQGIQHHWTQAGDMSETDWLNFYQCYCSTYVKKGQIPYLNLNFFETIAAAKPNNIVCLMAKQADKLIACSLFFTSDTTLFGRYWGCIEEKDALHFETCLYQGIDYTIDHSLQYFDAGAQGEHKLSRGFEPVATCSWHWINSPRFREPIRHYVARESELIKDYHEDCKTLLPFKQTP